MEQGDAVGVVDVVGGEAGDAGDWLGVEQHEQASEAVADGGGIVVQQGAGEVPAVLVVGEVQGLAGLLVRQVDAGDESVVLGPGQERAQGVAAGEVCVDVALAQGVE
jgi:hypothetical protein